eukprot:3517615-Pyramimonas_sp.AAC.1
MAEPNPQPAKKGRPSKRISADSKEKFYSGFTLFSESRGHLESVTNEEIQSGGFLKGVSQQWQALPREERERLNAIAKGMREAAKMREQQHAQQQEEQANSVNASGTSYWDVQADD